jgi:Na+-translocating ferredoxin:NAD+ oxidoreductase RnfC subunit
VQHFVEEVKNCGVCIYICEDLKFSTINLHKYCKEQILEISGIQIEINEAKIMILSTYRAPSGNFDYFINIVG